MEFYIIFLFLTFLLFVCVPNVYMMCVSVQAYMQAFKLMSFVWMSEGNI